VVGGFPESHLAEPVGVPMPCGYAARRSLRSEFAEPKGRGYSAIHEKVAARVVVLSNNLKES
jgi:hypothetical protein